MYITFLHLHKPTQVSPLSVKVTPKSDMFSKNVFNAAGKLMSQKGAATTSLSAAAIFLANATIGSGTMPEVLSARTSGVIGSKPAALTSMDSISYLDASASFAASRIFLVLDSGLMQESITRSLSII